MLEIATDTSTAVSVTRTSPHQDTLVYVLRACSVHNFSFRFTPNKTLNETSQLQLNKSKNPKIQKNPSLG